MLLPLRVQALIDSVLGPSGATDPSARRAAFEQARRGSGTTQDDPFLPKFGELLKKIDQRPWTVADEDFRALREAGRSENQIFEITLAAALGAGVRRLEAGLRALETVVSKTQSSETANTTTKAGGD